MSDDSSGGQPHLMTRAARATTCAPRAKPRAFAHSIPPSSHMAACRAMTPNNHSPTRTCPLRVSQPASGKSPALRATARRRARPLPRTGLPASSWPPVMTSQVQ